MSMSASRMFPSMSRDQTAATAAATPHYTNQALLSTSPPQTQSPASPTSPSRSGRLRGLNYLRSYTQNHLLSRDSRGGEARDHSQSNSPAQSPALPSPRSASVPVQNEFFASQMAHSTTQTHTTSGEHIVGNTSGWLPTVGGHSVSSRVATDPLPTTAASPSAVLSSASPNMIRRSPSSAAATNGSTTNGSITNTSTTSNASESQTPSETAAIRSPGMSHQLPSIRFSAHPDPRAQRPSLVFSPMARILPTGHEVIKVGRYSERDNLPSQSMNVPSAAPVGFKSKVVSRRHCEFWCTKGKWYIKDVKSSSGTFLNHIRLSAPGTESKPFPVNNGDILQLGIDFKGGEEMIFRCVKIRIELNKGWQTGPSSFNVQSHKRLRELNKSATSSSQDCSICLGGIAPCQSLFVAPCSHTWHYKCIRVIINGPHWPHFICPNCRAVADLEADVDDPYVDGEWEEGEALAEAEAEDSPGIAGEDEDVTFSRLRVRQNAISVHVDRDATPVMPNGIPSPLAARHGSGSGSGSPENISEEDISPDSEPPMADTDQSDSDQNVSPATPPPQGMENSHATVQLVDIVSGRKAAGTVGGGGGGGGESGSVASHAEQLLNNRRTPTSPGIGSPDPLNLNGGVEGPMTPTNDAGPFILDGSGRSGGRGAVPRIGSLGTGAAGAGTSASGDTSGGQQTRSILRGAH